MSEALSVTRLVRRMRNFLEIEIGEIWVEGEISNLRRQASGHCYFTLKDVGAQVSCVLFRGNAVRAKARPENGMQARLFGEVSIYETRGQLQLIVQQIENAGLGDLQARFDTLKRKLDDEGLFDQATKQPLPSFPRKIGLVTSPAGAALQDMLSILRRRAPWVQPVLYPAKVQGKGAEAGIARAIGQLGNPAEYDLPRVDVIIIGRGGGSLEDLWNFNEEIVARAIHACPIPLVSAVGHETDFTISDFVADMRAPTPSAAAELVVPDAGELNIRISRSGDSMLRAMENKLRHDAAILASSRRSLIPRDARRALRDPIQELDRARQKLRDASDSHLDSLDARLREVTILHAAHHPSRVMQRRADRLDHVRSSLDREGKRTLQHAGDRLHAVNSLVKMLGPDATFARGFSITTDGDGHVITNASEVGVGKVIETQFSLGKLKSRVEEQQQ